MQSIEITGKIILEVKAELQLGIVRIKIKELDGEIDKLIKLLEEVNYYETKDSDYRNYCNSIEFLG